jgi:hypothetical protein
LVEQLTLNQRVTGSSPVAPTNHFNNLRISALTLKNVVSALCPQSRWGATKSFQVRPEKRVGSK